MASQDLLCELFEVKANLSEDRLRWVNAIEALAGTYYILLSLLGFRNIYVIFYKQKKYATVIFPLMYLFAQAVCILQTAECFLFYSLNRELRAYCFNAVPISEAAVD